MGAARHVSMSEVRERRCGAWWQVRRGCGWDRVVVCVWWCTCCDMLCGCMLLLCAHMRCGRCSDAVWWEMISVRWGEVSVLAVRYGECTGCVAGVRMAV